MTPEDPESRRIADELKRRERQRPGTGASVDPATLQAILEQHAGAVATLVGEIETGLAAKIDTLANAQGAVAESLKREIERTRKAGDPDRVAALEGLSKDLKREFAALKASLDKREGGVFAGIDQVAESVRPAAEAIAEMRQAVAGTSAAVHHLEAIRKLVGDGLRALADVTAIKVTVTRSEKAIDDVLKKTSALDEIKASVDTWTTGMRRLRWLGWVVLVLVAVLFSAGGVALQRETGIWPPPAEMENRDRDEVWERYGEQIVSCRDTARKLDKPMVCTIVVMDP